MPKTPFIITILMLCAAQCFAQQPDPAMLEELKRKAAAMQHINKDMIRRNPDSIMKVLGKFLKYTDSTKGAIVNNALNQAPNSSIVKLYLNTKSYTDTSYTTVQFTGRTTESLTGPSETYNKVSTVSGTSANAPLVQRGSTFSVTMYSKDLMTARYSAGLANSYGSLARYLTNQMAVEATASYNNYNHQTSEEGGHTLHSTISETGTGNANQTQFVFSFDTLTNIGQVSMIKYTTINHHRTYDTVVGNSVQSRSEQFSMVLPLGASATTNPASWHLSEMKKDASSNLLDSLTGGQLSVANTNVDAQDKPVLIVTKKPWGFVMKCDYDNTEDGRTTSIHITAYIGRPVTRYEAVIYPVVPLQDAKKETYEQWLPEGPKLDGSDDTKGNDKLSFYVVVKDKNDATKIYHNYTASWSLLDVTAYRGFCNNYPKYSDDPDVGPDLTFHNDTKQDVLFDGHVTNSTAITNKGQGEFGVVKINCLDYAAWGKLAAHITLDDGTELEAHPYYEAGVDHITLPYDRDENKLADYWEKKVGIFAAGHALTWDEDDKMEQKESGDGLTLFEEYRGFFVEGNVLYKGDKVVVKDNFVRTDPAYKDVFVYDKNELFEKYYAADNPAHLNWHYVTAHKDQLVFNDDNDYGPANRWINFNKVDEYFYARQYALLLIKDIVSYDAGAGGITWAKSEYDYSLSPMTEEDEARWHAAANTEGRQGPLQSQFKCVVYVPVIQQKFLAIKHDYGEAKYTAVVNNQIKITVIHEVGHNIGIPHHSPPNGAVDLPAFETRAPGAADGVTSCPMRYYNAKEAGDINEVSTPAIDYCRKGQLALYYSYSYTLNADGTKAFTIGDDGKKRENPPVVNVAGNKESDNCWGQITVKSKPVE